MADLLIRGASEYATIIVTLGKAYNAVSGEDYELVVLPKHGRLIDTDELLKRKGDCYDYDGHLLYAVGTGDIMLAPTVIEASEDGEQDG